MLGALHGRPGSITGPQLMIPPPPEVRTILGHCPSTWVRSHKLNVRALQYQHSRGLTAATGGPPPPPCAAPIWRCR